MMMRRIACAFVMLLAVTLSPVHAQEQSELIIFAASSLTDVFEELGQQFEAEYPQVDVIFNFGASSTLAAQLAEGAPGDVFASANTAQMEVVCESGRISEQPRIFAHNRLVVAIPVDNPADIQSLDDLASPGVKLVLAAEGVPIRDYTERMLSLMAADPAYGEAYRAAVLANLVSEEDNVRQAVTKVALGEADASIVYHSDITAALGESVLALDVSDAFNTLADYPVAVIADSPNPELAQAFVDLLLSPQGQAIIERWSFIPVDPPADEATPEASVTPEATAPAQLLMPACSSS